MKNIKKILKLTLPPVVIFAIRRLFKFKFIHYKMVESWDFAKNNSVGYNDNLIIEKVKFATRAVVNGDYLYERDSILFDDIQYSWPLLAGILIAAENCGELNVIDYGGSLGSTYRQNKKFLDNLSCQVQWKVVEQKLFSDAGKSEFTTRHLKFFDSLEDARLGGCNVFLLASTIGYIDNPDELIRVIKEISPNYIVVDRTVVSDREKYLIQQVPGNIYKASYPLRVFDFKELIDSFSDYYDLIEKWDCEMQGNPFGKLVGFIMKLRD
jgi:putative methyltransferase (TIGR04325 family)